MTQCHVSRGLSHLRVQVKHAKSGGTRKMKNTDRAAANPAKQEGTESQGANTVDV